MTAKGNKIKQTVTAIIQARIESKRLPGKALLDLAGKPLLQHVIENTLATEGVDLVVLATTKKKEDHTLVELGNFLGIEVFQGSESNVLERYYLASEKYGGDFIVRVTGDNPLVDPEYNSMAIDIALESKADLCSLANLPLGTLTEIIKKAALDETYKKSDRAYQLEHVTPYIKKHSDNFHIERHPVSFDTNFEGLRLTVDTKEDYELVKIIYDELYENRPILLKEIVAFLNANPELAKINSKIIQRPMTMAEDDI